MITVLYVDDEPDLLEVGKLFLERKGEFSVTTVTSGKKAIELLGESAFEAIISDYQMPEMNGIELLKLVRAAKNNIPFIIFTGRGREEIVIQALNEGADFYIQKGGEPVSQFAELAHKIQKAVLQRRAEASIRDHERRETDIINFLPDATFAIDTRGVVIAWNQAMEKMTGVRAEEVLGKGEFEYALPFYHERRPILIDLVLNDDPNIIARYPYVTREGDKFFSEITIPHFNNGEGAALWFTASPLYNTRGMVVGAIESIREITERKRAEEALNESEKRFRELSDLLPQTIFESDLNGNLTYANRIAFEMFGYGYDDLEAGLTIREMVAPEDRDRAADGIHGIVEQSSKPITKEYLARRKDGTTFPVAIYSSPVTIEGRITGIRGIIVDISERRMAEEALQQSEIRFRSLIQNASDMIRILDREGKVVYESPSTEAIMGYPPGENIGKDPLQLIHPDDLERVKNDLHEVYDRTNPGTPTEFRARKADGTYLWVDSIATNMLDVPAVNGIVITTRPIEQRKILENAILESEEKYRLVVENSHDAIYIHRNDRLIFVNNRSAEVTGHSKDELLNMNLWDLVHPDDRTRLQQSAARRLTGQEVQSYFSARLVTKNGEVREGDFFVDRVDYLGQAAILGIFRDSTELNRAARSILESEEKYRTVFETTGTATTVLEDDGTISLANSEFERLSGYRKEEIENRKKWTEFVAPEDLERMVAQHKLRRTDPKNALLHYEFRFISRNREIHNIYLSIGVIPGTKRSVASLLDITERKKTEDNLVAANQEYTNLLSQIQDVYYRSDPEGRLVKASRSWADLLGYDDVSECIGRNIATDFYFNPPDRVRFLEEIGEEGKVTNYEVLLRKKDGTPVLVATNSHLTYDSSGRITGIEGTFRDITELKQQEKILKSQLSLGLALQTTRGMEDTLNVCLSAAIRISGMDSGGIYLVDTETGSLNLSVWENLSDEFVEAVATFPAGSVRAETVNAGKPVYVPFDAVSPRHTPAQIQEGLRSIAILPVTFGGRVIACLNVTSHTRGEIPESSRVALETLATQIGAAVERIRADEALYKSEQRYRNVVEDQTEFISRFLPDGTHIFVNEAYCRYFGMRREEILGHRFRPKIPPEDKARVERFFESLTPDQPVGIIEHRIIMPDGTIRWQRWSDRAIFDADGLITEYQSVGRDITDKREAEEALRQSYLVVENSPAVLFRWKAAEGWPVVFVSRNVIRFGYTPEELLSGITPYTAIIHPDDVGRVTEEVEKYAKDGTDQYRQEYRIVARDGRIHWVDDRTLIEREPDGRITHFQGILLDITEQKRSDELLRESEEKYRTLVEHSQDGVFIVQDGRLVFYNKAFAEMTGYDEPELIGRPIAETIAPEDREMVLSRYKERVSGGTVPASYEFSLLHKDGTSRIRVRMYAGKGTFRGSPAVIGTFHNITEEEKREEALRESRELFRKIFENSPLGIAILSPDFRFRLVNRQFCRMLQYDEDELLKKTFADITHPDHIAPDLNGSRKIYTGEKEAYRTEKRYVRKDGSFLWASVTAAPVKNSAGIITYTIALIEDINERKKVEEQLVAMSREYTGILDQMQDVFYRTDTEGRLIRLSRSMGLMLGFGDGSELIGKDIGQDLYYHPDDRKHFLEAISREGKVFNFETRLKTKEGSPVWISVNSHVWYRPDGTVGGVEGTIRDITEEKRIADALKESEAKYRSLSEASPDLIFVIDRTDTVTYLNSSAAEMIGSAAQDIIGRKRTDLFPPEVAESQGRAIRKVFETGEPFRSTGKLGFPMGSFWFDHAILPIRDTCGKVSLVLGISRDITDLKTAEEALRERTGELDDWNRVFSTILDSVPIGIFMVEAPSGKLIIANREGRRLVGQGPFPEAIEENVSLFGNVFRTGTGAQYPVHELPIIRGIHGEVSHVDDVIVVHPDGTRFQLEVFGTPVTDNQGQVIASLVSFLDITERKRAEEEFEGIQEKYTKAFLAVPDAITISELDTGKFIEVNDAATVLFGYSREELIGRSAAELGIWLKEEDRAFFFGLLEKEGRIRDFEVVERKKTGVQYTAMINADILTIGGRKYLIAILRDITERRRTEQVIREQNQKINLLTSITRHDVANQVSILKGYAQIARMKGPSPDIDELLEKIDTAGSAIARQIEFTRTYQDLGLQAPRWVEIRELVERQKRESVMVSCSCDVAIFADPMLEKVFFNLFDNAVRHGDHVTSIAVSCDRDGDNLVITVKDDGIGIPADLKEKIFEKGFGKHTGFGLFLAREILSITDMTIRETGVPGEGARFEIVVPEGVWRNG